PRPSLPGRHPPRPLPPPRKTPSRPPPQSRSTHEDPPPTHSAPKIQQRALSFLSSFLCVLCVPLSVTFVLPSLFALTIKHHKLSALLLLHSYTLSPFLTSLFAS